MGTLGQMGTRINMHQDKWIIRANGHWGQISIAYGGLGQMGIESMWGLGQMGI